MHKRLMRVPYYHDPRIHTFGNTGPGGWVHALLAPLATAMITQVAYGGSDPRVWLAAQVAGRSVADLGCGTGTSTAPGAWGVDTSPEMLAVARARRPDAAFALGNAETWGETDEFDVATMCFVMHEMPRSARRRALRNALRVSRQAVMVLDICPTYQPSWSMQAGEPYLDDYKRHVESDLQRIARVTQQPLSRIELMPGHVICWVLGTTTERQNEITKLLPEGI